MANQNDDPNIGRIAVTPDNQSILWTGQGWIPAGSREAIPFLRGAGNLDPNKLEAVGAGASNIYEGARQVFGLSSPEREAEVAENKAIFNDNASTSDKVAEFVGEAAMTAPLGGVAGAGRSLVTRAALGGAAGGASGGLAFAEEDRDRVRNTAFGLIGGGVFGAIAPSLVRGLESGSRASVRQFRRLFNLLPKRARAEVDKLVEQSVEMGKTGVKSTDDALREDIRRLAFEAKVNGSDVTPEMLARQARAKSAGFAGDTGPTLGQLNRDPLQIGTEKNIAKLEGGEKLATLFENQEAQMSRVLKSMAAGDELDSEAAGLLAQNAVKRVSTRLQDGVKAAYQKAADNYGDGAELSLDSFRKHMGSVVNDFEDSISGDVKRRIADFASESRPLVPEELVKLDQLITGSVGPSVAPNQYTAANLLKRELVRIWGDSGYADAKKLASQRFRLIGRRQGINARLLADESDESAKVLNKMMTGSWRDLVSLKRMIGNEPEWQDLQSAVLQKIVARSFSNADDPLSTSGFKPAVFRNLIHQKIGKRRLTHIFGEEGAEKLRNLANVSDDLFNLPRGHSANLSNSGVFVAQGFMRLLQLLGQTKLGARVDFIGAGAKRADKAIARQAISGLPGPSPRPSRPIIDALTLDSAAAIGGLGSRRAIEEE